MKRWIALLVALLTAAGAACAEAPHDTPVPAAGEAAAETSVCAVGTASVPAPADIAVLTLCVQAEDETVAGAQAQADEALEQLRAALEALDVEGARTHGARYAVETMYDYHYSKLSETETPTGYAVSAEMTVRLDDVARVGEVIDAALAAGARSDYVLSYESSQWDEAYSEAVALAAEDAMRKAELLAQSAGLVLGRLVSVSEVIEDEQEPVSGGEAPAYLPAVAVVEVCYTAQP